jgi:hypothetical protein
MTQEAGAARPIVERLLRKVQLPFVENGDIIERPGLVNPDGPEAADTITELVEALKDARACYWVGRGELRGEQEFVTRTWEKLKALDDALLAKLEAGDTRP